jgi:hypothetical protein
MPSFADLSLFTTYSKPNIHYYEFTIKPIVDGISRTTVAVVRQPRTASSSKKPLFKLEPKPELDSEPDSEPKQYSTYTPEDDVIYLYSWFIQTYFARNRSTISLIHLFAILMQLLYKGCWN